MTFTYQTLPELSPSMISNRSPPYQFMLRLRDFPPSLTHLIAVASTASVDVSLATKSKIPLSSDLPPEKAVDVFTATVMADDSRRAQLPMTESMTDTSPVGIAIDLSSKEKVQRPLPREEFEESPGPLPAIMVLNNEGVLAAWWLVYAESIRQCTSYPGLAALGNAPNHQTHAQRQSSTTPTPSTPANGQNAFGSMLTPSAPISSPSPSQAPAQFGPNPATAFGAPSGLNQKVPLWSGNATGSQAPSAPFGQPAFPSSNNAANPQQSAAFGASSALGHRSSPWGTPSSGTATTAGGAFGQPAKLGSQASPFASLPGGNTDNKNPSSGANPFAAFANKQAGFNAVPSTPGNKTSVFGQHSTSVPFNAGAGSSGMFGQPEKPAESASVFGTGGFQLNSTFKGDGSAANDGPKPEGDGSASLFGNNFGSRLGETTSKDADMDESEDQAPQQAEGTPFKLASPKLFGQPAEIPSTGSLFGNTRETKNEVNAGQDSKPAGFQFGSVSPRKEEPGGAQAENPSDSPPEDSPKIKEEPLDDGDISPLNDEEAKPPEGYDEAGRDNQTNPETPPGSPPRSPSRSPELPVPPESTSKTAFAPGDSSNSSKSSDDVPLPPDFLPTKSKLQDVETATPEKLQLPETSGEDQDTDAEKERDSASGSLDDEGSGVDVAQEISPSSSKESSKITPGSSFGRNSHMTGPEKLFGATQEDDSPPKPSLFGEVGKSSAPIFPLPKPQQSPRSPSPVRLPTALNRLRPESSRSLSAPGPIKPASVLTNESKTQASRPKPQVSAKDLRSREKERLDAERSRLFDQEHQPLSDDEDNEIQKSLADDIEPSTTLENFVAHQDYVGRVEKPGIPGQIEKVFRDINSMIDTLGINTRSLIAFTKAHGIRSNPPRSHREDLEDLDDWHLIDIEDLNNVEDKLFVQLEEDQIEEVPTKLSSIRQMRAEIRQLRLQSHELARSTDLDTGLGVTKGSNQRPLNLDQQTQLKDLRRAFKQFQKLLADAEKGLMQLRKDLAVQGGDRPRNGKPSLRQPTAEAVEKTIRKMTNMIIEKNNDIEQLSSQMSSLQFGPSLTNSQFSNGESRGSRHGTPTRAGASGLGASANRASTNRSAQRLKSSLREFNPSATSSNGASAPVSGPANFEYIEEVREKSKRRKEVNEAIKQVFGNGDLKVRPLD